MSPRKLYLFVALALAGGNALWLTKFDYFNYLYPGTDNLPNEGNNTTTNVRKKNLTNLSNNNPIYKRFEYHAPRSHTFNDTVESSCGEAPEYKEWFAQNMKQRSANNEDRDVYNRLFRPFLEGNKTSLSTTDFTYLEIGAFNGIRESNTRFFDKCLGWSGLLVEGNPNKQIWNELIENRPTAHRMHFAASCPEHEAHNATIPFFKSPYTNAGQSVGVISAYTNTSVQQIPMPCGSLTPFIQDLLGGRVSFMSLDVEGAEPYILQHLDFTKVIIDVMIIENYNSLCPRDGVCQSRNMFRDLMEEAGYVRPLQHQFVRKSDLWFHPESQYLQPLEAK